jgi:cold shock CspA family protein
MAMYEHGRIKTVKEDKGYYFIVPDAQAPDVFGHIRQWSPEGTVPRVGQRVQFVVVTGRDGRLEAADVSPLDGEHELSKVLPSGNR